MQLIRWLAHYTTLAAQIVSELWTTCLVSVNDFQGDREGRPYNTKLPVLHVNVYCRGDPRGRPGSHLQTLDRLSKVQRQFGQPKWYNVPTTVLVAFNKRVRAKVSSGLWSFSI